MRKAAGMAGNGRRKGFTYIEVLVAIMLVAVAASGLFACVRITTMTPRTKRTTEMAVYISVAALERIKAQKFLSMTDIMPLPATPVPTGVSSWYYDKNGVPATSASTGGYTVLYGVHLDDTNGDGVYDTRDMRHIVVEVRDNTLAKLYERIDSYLAFGGV
jgi:prepilin-type N-terminal cleavage/methylation domain-containing protein